MNIISNAASLMSNVLTARAERIAATPGSEEEVKPTFSIVLDASKPEDQVIISQRAQEMQKLEEMRKTAPRIDWENRTFMGQKIPDTWHKEPTPEMISGEQPYEVWTNVLSGERKYVEAALPQKERTIQYDMQQLQNMDANLQRMEQMQQHYASSSRNAGVSPDPRAQAILAFQKDEAQKEMQRFLELMVIGYDKLGYDLQYAHDYMKETSLGTFDLAALLEKYFGAES